MTTQSEMKERFASMIIGVAESFGRSLSEHGIKAYWVALKDIEITKLNAAMLKAMQTSKHMPTIAEIREMCGCDTADSRSIKAWDVVSRSAGSIGSYRSVNFQDATINAVIRNLGGWPEILSRSGDEWDKWTRMEFIKAYKSLDGNVKAGSEICSSLPGLGNKNERPCYVAVEYVVSDEVRRIPEESKMALVQESETRKRSNPLAIRELLQLRSMQKGD